MPPEPRDRKGYARGPHDLDWGSPPAPGRAKLSLDEQSPPSPRAARDARSSMSDRGETTPPRAALSATVLALGVVSLCTDAASDMVWPLLPALLAQSMHASVAYAGVIEGLAEATAALAKYLVGRRSDQMQQRKPYVLAGYALSTAARPLLAIAAAPWHALVIRLLDRVGKGLRSAPRDALIAEATPKDQRAVAFGFHRAMDNAGAVLGPILALAVLAWSGDNVRAVALASLVPGVLAVLAIVLLVRERPRARPEPLDTRATPPAESQSARILSPVFKRYLAVVALFALGNASDVFIVAQALRAGVSTRSAAGVLVVLALVRTIAATPGGWLAERVGRKRSLVAGWVIYALVYAAFPLARSFVSLAALAAVYGLYYGLCEGAEKALVAKLAHDENLGRAYGAFALVSGLGALAANLLFAALVRVGDGRAAWWTCAAFASLAALALATAVHERPSPALAR